MKKMILLWVSLGNSVFGQEVAVVPQSYSASCWAATLEMTAKYIIPKEKQKNQCYFIKKNGDILDNECCKICQIEDENCHTGVAAISPEKLFNLTKNEIKNTAQVTYATLGLPYLINHIKKVPKMPILYDFDYFAHNNKNAHVCLMTDIINLNFNNSKKQLYLIQVKDSAPVCEGTEYFMTYEQFYARTESHKERHEIVFKGLPKNIRDSNIASMTNSYLKNKMFKSDSIKKLAQTFINELGNTKDIIPSIFFRITGLPMNKDSIVKLNIGEIIEVVRVGETQILMNNSEGINRGIELKKIHSWEHQEHLVCMEKDNIIRTILIVSNKKLTNNDSSNNWFISSFENGKAYNKILKQ